MSDYEMIIHTDAGVYGHFSVEIKGPGGERIIKGFYPESGGLEDGVLGIGEAVAGAAGRAGLPAAVRRLQEGLNGLLPLPGERGREPLFSPIPLKTDGRFGPRTHERLWRTVAALGPERVKRRFGDSA